MDQMPYTGFDIKEYLEPTLCFTTERMKVGESYPLEKLPVSQLVMKGEVLVEFGEEELVREESQILRTVVAGENSEYSEDRMQVLAKVTGYPKIEFCPKQDREKVSEEKLLQVSVDPLFELSTNWMEASILIQSLLFNYTTISSEDLYQLLTGSGIVSGVDYKQLKYVRDAIRRGHIETEKIVLARGKKTVPGTNAHLRFELEIGPIAGELLKNGNIDFRERKIMVPVSKGQVIATLIPATMGTPGVTVMGDRIAQQPGMDLDIKTENDALYDKENEQVIATSDGVLTVVGDNVIKVCSKQEIQGDIDYSTGNIESRNSVLIHGSVLPGFLVKTDGDMEIRGSVMSTRVNSRANAVIKGGIIGSGSVVQALGDVDILFIEQGKISCGGNCIVRRQSYYSYISAGGHIRCKEQSVIAGGELVAEGSISLGNVGAQGADPVFIAAGVVAERLYQARKIEQRLKEEKASIVQRLKGYTGAARPKKLESLKNGIQALKLQHLRINLIPHTGRFSRLAGEQEVDEIEQLEHGRRQNVDIRKITIDVHGTIFAGSILQIGNRSLTVEETTRSRRFRIDETRKKILATPLT